jgi:hypothetical protein
MSDVKHVKVNKDRKRGLKMPKKAAGLHSQQ